MFNSRKTLQDFFAELHPSLQDLFQTVGNVSLQKLIEKAGLQGQSIHQHQLITSLKQAGITASVTDIAKISMLETLRSEPEQRSTSSYTA